MVSDHYILFVVRELSISSGGLQLGTRNQISSVENSQILWPPRLGGISETRTRIRLFWEKRFRTIPPTIPINRRSVVVRGRRLFQSFRRKAHANGRGRAGKLHRLSTLELRQL
jgi:hypothetical protein